MTKLESGEKEVIQVSQENIISNLVEQTEKCGQDELNYRDVFVTAPTGAGKSVMFQIPAIYLAEKYNLLTIVISPLIGLMNDQVRNLELKVPKLLILIFLRLLKVILWKRWQRANIIYFIFHLKHY